MRQALQAGCLQVVLNDFPPTELGMYALYTPNRYLAAKTRVLIDFLADRFDDLLPLRCRCG